jgi:hypothetical protein
MHRRGSAAVPGWKPLQKSSPHSGNFFGLTATIQPGIDRRGPYMVRPYGQRPGYLVIGISLLVAGVGGSADRLTSSLLHLSYGRTALRL